MGLGCGGRDSQVELITQGQVLLPALGLPFRFAFDHGSAEDTNLVQQLLCMLQLCFV